MTDFGRGFLMRSRRNSGSPMDVSVGSIPCSSTIRDRDTDKLNSNLSFALPSQYPSSKREEGGTSVFIAVVIVTVAQTLSLTFGFQDVIHSASPSDVSIFVIIALFTMGSDFLSPLVPVLAGSDIDPEFRDHGSMDHFTLRQCSSARVELPASFTGPLPQQLPSHQVPAFSTLCCHLPDLVQHRELVLVPHSGSLDRRRRIFQSLLQFRQPVAFLVVRPVAVA